MFRPFLPVTYLILKARSNEDRGMGRKPSKIGNLWLCFRVTRYSRDVGHADYVADPFVTCLLVAPLAGLSLTVIYAIVSLPFTDFLWNC